MDIAVVDAGANLKAFHSKWMTPSWGALILRFKKAKTARMFNMPSGTWASYRSPEHRCIISNIPTTD